MSDIETNVEVPHFSERMAKISAKAERDRAKQREKEKKEQQELTKALETVDELAPRIKALIEMANACKREDMMERKAIIFLQIM